MLTFLAFPPAELWPLAFVGLVPFLWVLRGSRPRRGLLLGAAFGAAFYGATLYWIALFGTMAWTALTLASAASVAVFGLAAPVVWRDERPIGSAAGLAALWVVVDWARSLWPVGGFTWGQLGVSQVDNRATVRLATVAGVWGVTFVVVWVNALLVVALSRGSGGAVRRAGSMALAAAAALAPLALPFSVPDGRSISVATVQVDVRIARGLPSLQEDRAVAGLNVREDAQLAKDRPDLVIWGESSLDPGATTLSFFPTVQASIASVGVPTLAGSVQPGPTAGSLQNQVLVFDGRGRVVDRYAKVHLVPFGEYVPFRRELSGISALRQIPYDLTPGAQLHTVEVPGVGTVGTPICFENSFPSIDRELVNQGAGFLAVLTNNASYELTAASRQHLQMSRMRAIEDGRWVVHAAVSGISAYIDTSGRVVGEAGLFRTGILRHTIRTSDARTWYVRLGDWAPRVSLLLLAGLFLPARRRRPSHGRPSPLPAAPRTLVILPTYNEKDTIETVIERLRASPVDMLVVDDSSPDGTAAIAQGIAEREPRLRVRVRPAKSGLASAYLEAFETAIAEGYDLVVEMDSDLSHDPDELHRLLEGAERQHLTVGSRYIPGGSVTNWSRARVALSRVGNVYARFMLSLPIHDATSGYRVLRRELVSDLIREPLVSDGYGFQIELVYRAWRLGYEVGEAPITFREREHGVSKISRKIVIEALWLVTKWGLRARLGGA